jgi:hypothetical protein
LCILCIVIKWVLYITYIILLYIYVSCILYLHVSFISSTTMIIYKRRMYVYDVLHCVFLCVCVYMLSTYMVLITHVVFVYVLYLLSIYICIYIIYSVTTTFIKYSFFLIFILSLPHSYKISPPFLLLCRNTLCMFTIWFIVCSSKNVYTFYYIYV